MSKTVSLVLLALFSAAPSSAAPAPAVLAVSGDLPKTGGLSMAELEALGPTSSTWTAHGEKHEVYGVALEKILSHFGFEPGPMAKDVPSREKRRGWRMVVIASATDGFQAVLSCAEIFESMGATRALLIWKVDGKPLPADRGPLRLAVLTDKEPSRSIYNLRTVRVMDLRDAAVPAKR
jgi:Oxidoreductase molybdopterin binding domain